MSLITMRVGFPLSVSVSNNKIFVSHDEGIPVVDLQSHERHTIYTSQNAKCTVVAFKKGIRFTDQQKATLFQTDELNNIEKFAGGEVEGCQVGPIAECKFKQPMGAYLEFDNVVYVCDAQSNSVKIVLIFPLPSLRAFLPSATVGGLCGGLSHTKTLLILLMFLDPFLLVLFSPG